MSTWSRWGPRPHTFFALVGCVPQGKEKPPLCKGGTAWRSHAGGIVRPIEWFSPGLIAQRGSAGCQRRHFVNPTGGIRRHLPLHKGGFFARLHTTSPGSVAQRGSAVWVQRHAAKKEVTAPGPTDAVTSYTKSGGLTDLPAAPFSVFIILRDFPLCQGPVPGQYDAVRELRLC